MTDEKTVPLPDVADAQKLQDEMRGRQADREVDDASKPKTSDVVPMPDAAAMQEDFERLDAKNDRAYAAQSERAEAFERDEPNG